MNNLRFVSHWREENDHLYQFESDENFLNTKLEINDNIIISVSGRKQFKIVSSGRVVKLSENSLWINTKDRELKSPPCSQDVPPHKHTYSPMKNNKWIS